LRTIQLASLGNYKTFASSWLPEVTCP